MNKISYCLKAHFAIQGFYNKCVAADKPSD